MTLSDSGLAGLLSALVDDPEVGAAAYGAISRIAIFLRKEGEMSISRVCSLTGLNRSRTSALLDTTVAARYLETDRRSFAVVIRAASAWRGETNRPTSGTDRPGTDCPTYGTDRPTPDTDRPGTIRPTIEADRPDTDRPTSGTNRPTYGTDRPTPGTDRPGTIRTKPGTIRPTSGTDRPTDAPNSTIIESIEVEIPKKSSATDEVVRILVVPDKEGTTSEEESLGHVSTSSARGSKSDRRAQRVAKAGEHFARFWDAWMPGRKVAQDSAQRAFETALRRGADPDEVIAGAKRYVAHEKARGTQLKFVAHPTTWLNDGRWKDELPEPVDTSPERLRALAAVDQAILDTEHLGGVGLSWQARALFFLGKLGGSVVAGQHIDPDLIAEAEALRADLDLARTQGVRIPSFRALTGADTPFAKRSVPAAFRDAFASALRESHA